MLKAWRAHEADVQRREEAGELQPGGATAGAARFVVQAAPTALAADLPVVDETT